MDLSQITRIVELMSKHELTEIDIKSEDFALTIKRERRDGGREPHVIAAVPAMPALAAAPVAPAVPAAAPAPAPAPAAAPVAAAPAKDELAGLVPIESPLVGTFYAAASPEAPAFVKVGDKVAADTVVCIVEAMKVMNEIKAERAGVVRKVMVENAQPVEFGQPLFYLEPA
jgi:acetyl-CoA carboxylase biotin carboxyl carrier protein